MPFFVVQKVASALLSGTQVTVTANQAAVDALVLEAGSLSGTIRCNIQGTETLRIATGQVSLTKGTSTVPGLAGIGEPDTGLSWYSANTISFILEGLERFAMSGAGLYGQSASGLSINAGVVDTPLFIQGRASTGATPSVQITNGGISFTASSGSQSLLSVAGTVNQSSTAAFTGMLVNITETAVGSGVQRLLDLQIGGTSRCAVDRTGKLVTTPQLVVATGDEVGVDISQTVNKATSGNYTGIKLNVTETSAPGTDDRLLDLQVGGTSMARVSNEGVIRGAEVQSVLFIEKGANESVLNNTFQNDDELVVTLKASAKYYFRIHLFINNAGATAAFKLQMTGTVGVSSLKGQVLYFTTTVSSGGRFAALTSAVFASFGAGDQAAYIEGTIETSTAGTFQLQWAQGTTDGANATTVQRNSSMLVHRIG
jgi:hypothetical protein